MTVQIPLFNEQYVARRAILAAASLRYPRERLEIQILDDSTDETSAIVAATCKELVARGIDVRHVKRKVRTGFKAGALANGLRTATGRLVAVLDADFVPAPDFLLRLVGEFADPTVGMVQARWSHLNEASSLLTRIQALQLDAHFTLEHGVRARTGCFFNFNGTAGIWRRDAIEDAGGWQGDTLTEDLDLSYRSQLNGWRFVYRDDVAVPAELPIEIQSYRQQQQRWAQGGIQTARKILPALLKADVPLRVKIEAFWHLTGNLTYPLIVALAVAGLATGFAGHESERAWIMLLDGMLLGFAGLSLGVFYGVTAWIRTPATWFRRTMLTPFLMILGAGIALGQSVAVFRALTGSNTPFHRTPKYRIVGNRAGTWRHAAYRVLRVPQAVADVLLGVVLLALTGTGAFIHHAWPTGLVVLLGLGFCSVGTVALTQARADGSA